MAVIDISTIPTRDLAPGIHARVMHGHALSMMRVHIDAGAEGLQVGRTLILRREIDDV